MRVNVILDVLEIMRQQTPHTHPQLHSKFFGSRVDAKSKKPLFNAQAWKKANNVLKEILEGFGETTYQRIRIDYG